MDTQTCTTPPSRGAAPRNRAQRWVSWPARRRALPGLTRLLLALVLALPIGLLGGQPRPALAAAGDLDPSFGTGGAVFTQHSAGGAAWNAVAIQADGKIVAAGGTFADVRLARFMPDGSLDVGFGAGGKVTAPCCSIGAMALQADGKIVLTGATLAGPSDPGGNVALLRYNSDGSPDGGFGVGGQALNADPTCTAGPRTCGASAVAIQADGRIVVAVDRAPSNVFAPIPFSGLLRFNSNGSLDNSFGPNCGVKGPLHGVAIQSDGKILAAGGTGGATIPNNVQDFALVRCRADGTFDTGFGTGGVARADFGGCEGATGLAVQPDGRIVLVGGLAVGYCVGPTSDAFLLARYNANGSLDAGFGAGGKVVSYFGGGSAGLAPRAVAIQSDGKIVAAGQFDNGEIYSFALVRYQAAGVGGLGFAIAPQPSSVALGWGGGSGQTSYLLARSPSGAWPLPAAATAYLDSAPAPAPSLDCYQLLPIGASSVVLAASDVLCAQLGVRSQIGPPPGFVLRLDESTTARLVWGSSGDQLGYVLLALPQGGSPRTLGLAASARWATDQTGGTPTCYVLYAVYPAGTGNTDAACAVPGRASFGATGQAAQGGAATPQAAQVVAAPVTDQPLDRQVRAGRTQVEQEAGKLRRKAR